jgi:hypothetical protein
MVDKVERGQEVSSKWGFKVKRLGEECIDKFKARLVAQDFTQYPGLDFDETDIPIIRFNSLQLLLAIMVVQGWCS